MNNTNRSYKWRIERRRERRANVALVLFVAGLCASLLLFGCAKEKDDPPSVPACERDAFAFLDVVNESASGWELYEGIVLLGYVSAGDTLPQLHIETGDGTIELHAFELGGPGNLLWTVDVTACDTYTWLIP